MNRTKNDRNEVNKIFKQIQSELDFDGIASNSSRDSFSLQNSEFPDLS